MRDRVLPEPTSASEAIYSAVLRGTCAEGVHAVQIAGNGLPEITRCSGEYHGYRVKPACENYAQRQQQAEVFVNWPHIQESERLVSFCRPRSIGPPLLDCIDQ